MQTIHTTRDDMSNLAAITVNVATETSDFQAAPDASYNGAVAHVLNAQKTALSAVIRANRAISDQPLEFLVSNRGQSAVRGILAKERIAISLPDSLNAGSRATLAIWRADSTGSASESRADTNTSAFTTAWHTSAGQ
jgi:hypothetical protein